MTGTDLTAPPTSDTAAVVLAQATPAAAPAACLNCGGVIAGRFCQDCGQRHDPQVHSVGHFLSEATEDLTHADSRVWRTLFSLLFKPGYLTQQFFVGKRASYLPPVRLYLVVSVLMFLLLSLTPEANTELIHFDSKDGAAKVTQASQCDKIQLDLFGYRWIEPTLRSGCHKALEDNGAELKRSFMHNAPRMMFLFLPLIAFFMMLLYWRPRRYYVEHLLFYIHNHAFVFLIAAGGLLIELLHRELPQIMSFAVMLYLAWYFFRATRVFYGESRMRTSLKLTFMGFVYIVLAALMLVITAVISVVTL